MNNTSPWGNSNNNSNPWGSSNSNKNNNNNWSSNNNSNSSNSSNNNSWNDDTWSNPWPSNNTNTNNNNPWSNNNNNNNRNNNNNNRNKNNNNNNNNNDTTMSMTNSKRRRQDPLPINNNDFEIPNIGNMSGRKRKRLDTTNEFYYGKQPMVVVQKAPYKDNFRTTMDIDGSDDDDDEDDELNFKDKEIKFEKGLMIDIKVKDEHEDDYWTTGIICKIDNDRILIHIPRYNPKTKWVRKDDPDIAPPGTHNRE